MGLVGSPQTHTGAISLEATNRCTDQVVVSRNHLLQRGQAAGGDSEQKTEARKTAEPSEFIDLRWTWDGIKIDRDPQTTGLREHRRRADKAAHADVLGGAGDSFLREPGQQGQLGLQPRWFSGGGRIPEGIVPVLTAIAIDEQHQEITALGRSRRKNGPIGDAEHGNREG